MNSLWEILNQFKPDRRRHPILEPQELDKEMVALPLPPTDLPKPRRGSEWRRWYALSFLITVVLLYLAGNLFGIPILREWPMIWTLTCLVWLFGVSIVGYLLFGSRAGFKYIEFGRGLKVRFNRYKRNSREDFFGLFPRLEIEGKGYFLPFYVPNTYPTGTRQLTQGSEPLLFDEHGQWIDDEKLFHKALLTWSAALEISPGTLENALIQGYNSLKKMVTEHLLDLHTLLDQNANRFVELGLATEIDVARQGYPAKVAHIRHFLDVALKKILWAEAHGWDSVVELRYDHVLAWHEAKVAAIESHQRFFDNHQLAQVERAASKLREAVNQHGCWQHRAKLLKGIEMMMVPMSIETTTFQKVGSEWYGPEVQLEGYRARTAFAREIDAKYPLNQKREMRVKRVKTVALWANLSGVALSVIGAAMITVGFQVGWLLALGGMCIMIAIVFAGDRVNSMR